MPLPPRLHTRLLLLFLLAWMLTGCIELRWPDEQEIQPLPVEIRSLTPEDAALPEWWRMRPVYSPSRPVDRWPIEDADWVVLSREKDRNSVSMRIFQLRNENSIKHRWDALAKVSIEDDVEFDGPTVTMGVDDLPVLHADNTAVYCESYYDGSWILCAVRLSYGPIFVDLSASIGERYISVTDFVDVVRSIDAHLHARLHGE